jgi:hypothetical protein
VLHVNKFVLARHYREGQRTKTRFAPVLLRPQSLPIEHLPALCGERRVDLLPHRLVPRRF